MKQSLGARLRERLRPAWARGRKPRRKQTGEVQERAVIDEIASEFTTEELQEFLEADLYPIEADPEFKEELRGKLWDLVQRQAAGRKNEDA